MEKPGIPPPGYKRYPGGHFLAYDMRSGKFENLARVPFGDGILSMTMDTQRGRLYGITWPTGTFLRYDLTTKELRNLGAVSEQGENGTGQAYRTLCRSLVVDPNDGSVYLSTGDGAILRYCYDTDSIGRVEGEDLHPATWVTIGAKPCGTRRRLRRARRLGLPVPLRSSPQPR